MKNIKDSETACKCCGLINYDSDSGAMIDMARDYSGIPYILNSACRCKKHNYEVGSKPTSSHIAEDRPSTAWDVKATTSRQRFKILKGLIKAGFTRIGIHKSFIHADSDVSKDPEVSWLY